MKMVARKPNRYGGKKRKFGDEVEVGKDDVRLVTALGWFAPIEEPKTPPPVKAAPKMQSRTMAAEPSAAERVPSLPEDPPPEPTWVGAGTDAPAKPEDATKPKRAYQRRDLRAED